MARKENIEQQVEKIVLELLEGQSEIEMVDVEYVKERDWYLRVFIDKEGGIEIDDCQALSEKLEERLDAEDFITDSYILEVSSPGIDRVLRKLSMLRWRVPRKRNSRECSLVLTRQALLWTGNCSCRLRRWPRSACT